MLQGGSKTRANIVLDNFRFIFEMHKKMWILLKKLIEATFYFLGKDLCIPEFYQK